LHTLEQIVENLPIPVTVVGKDNCFALVNTAYEKMFDIPRETLLGKHYTCNLTENEDSIHMRVLTKGKPASVIKIMGRQQKLVKAEAVPILSDGEVQYSVGIIYEFSTTEKAMSELEKRMGLMQKLKSDHARYSFEDIIGESESLLKAIETARKAAQTNVTVLLRGESGTGKELFAHAIHNESLRRNQKFIRINCAAIPESLLESILFGYEENSFTGAKKGGEIGLFEAADKGTIFLDEIGDISLSLQTKLLRVLQEREITRVGGVRPKLINVRVIAATNADLESKIEAKEFRSDLYYRLNVFPVQIPPLRDRDMDIITLAERFMRRSAEEFGKSLTGINRECALLLRRHQWPGNVRELDSIITRAVIAAPENQEKLSVSDVPFLAMLPTQPVEKIEEPPVSMENSLDDYQERFQRWEREMMQKVYLANGKNKSLVARVLGISVRSVYEKLKKYQIE